MSNDNEVQYITYSIEIKIFYFEFLHPNKKKVYSDFLQSPKTILVIPLEEKKDLLAQEILQEIYHKRFLQFDLLKSNMSNSILDNDCTHGYRLRSHLVLAIVFPICYQLIHDPF